MDPDPVKKPLKATEATQDIYTIKQNFFLIMSYLSTTYYLYRLGGSHWFAVIKDLLWSYRWLAVRIVTGKARRL